MLWILFVVSRLKKAFREAPGPFLDIFVDIFWKKMRQKRNTEQQGRLRDSFWSPIPQCQHFRKSLKTLCKIDILDRLAVRDSAWLRHCYLMLARMLPNASLHISEAFSVCFLDLCLARPNLQSQPEISIVIWYLHTKKAKNNKDKVKKQWNKIDP